MKFTKNINKIYSEISRNKSFQLYKKSYILDFFT